MPRSGISCSEKPILSETAVDLLYNERVRRAQVERGALASCADRLLAKCPDLEIVIVGDGVLSAERNLLADAEAAVKMAEGK